MRPQPFRKMKPLSTKMEDVLKEFQHREKNNEAPQSVYYTQSAKGLFQRGLLYSKVYTGATHSYLAFFLTEFGYTYLKFLEAGMN